MIFHGWIWQAKCEGWIWLRGILFRWKYLDPHTILQFARFHFLNPNKVNLKHNIPVAACIIPYKHKPGSRTRRLHHEAVSCLTDGHCVLVPSLELPSEFKIVNFQHHLLLILCKSDRAKVISKVPNVPGNVCKNPLVCRRPLWRGHWAITTDIILDVAMNKARLILSYNKQAKFTWRWRLFLSFKLVFYLKVWIIVPIYYAETLQLLDAGSRSSFILTNFATLKYIINNKHWYSYAYSLFWREM